MRDGESGSAQTLGTLTPPSPSVWVEVGCFHADSSACRVLASDLLMGGGSVRTPQHAVKLVFCLIY